MDTNVTAVVRYGQDSDVRSSAVFAILNLISQYGGDSTLAQTLITLDKSLQTLMIASITKFANEAVAALVVTPAAMPDSLQPSTKA